VERPLSCAGSLVRYLLLLLLRLLRLVHDRLRRLLHLWLLGSW
jgi:hypothetical protein